MIKNKENDSPQTIADLERQLEEARQETAYYKRISEEAGKKRLKEVDDLIQLIAARKRAEEKLAYLATHDALTGLPNRILFTEHLNHAILSAQRNGLKLAVMMLDLDKFKEINDTFGHRAGDQLLQTIGMRLTSVLRKSDTVARMGGDEFMLLLSELKKVDEASYVAHKLLQIIQEPIELENHELTVTFSIGISLSPDHGTIPDVLFKNADIAMYNVKRSGRNGYEFYSGSIDQAFIS